MEDRRAALLEAVGGPWKGKEVGACCCETGRPGQRLWNWVGGSASPPSCEEAQGGSWGQPLQRGCSREASGRRWSWTDALEPNMGVILIKHNQMLSVDSQPSTHLGSFLQALYVRLASALGSLQRRVHPARVQ